MNNASRILVPVILVVAVVGLVGLIVRLGGGAVE